MKYCDKIDIHFLSYKYNCTGSNVNRKLKAAFSAKRTNLCIKSNTLEILPSDCKLHYALCANTYQVSFILKCIMKPGDPISVSFHKDVPFLTKTSSLCTLQHLPFVQCFHSKHPAIVFHTNQGDLRKAGWLAAELQLQLPAFPNN